MSSEALAAESESTCVSCVKDWDLESEPQSVIAPACRVFFIAKVCQKRLTVTKCVAIGVHALPWSTSNSI